MAFNVSKSKRDLGTCWVEHQEKATSVYLNNLPETAGFFKPSNHKSI